MITLAILLCIIVALLFTVVSIGGGLILVLIDPIICVLIITFVVKLIKTIRGHH